MTSHAQNGTANGTAPVGPQAPVEAPGAQWLERFADLFTWEVFGDRLAQVAFFFLIFLAGYFLGRLARATYHYLRRQAPTSSQLLIGKSLHFVFVLFAVGVGLTGVFGVDLLGVAATFGLISLALGFGLQNTVANLAAGVGLTMDKPFEVGDRIRVGDTWGDVESIGLRSTRITTTSGEHVIVPNSVLDTQEVWNFTAQNVARIRLEIPVGISYGSSIELAEHLCLQVARGTTGVLAYPEPMVRVRRFNDNSVDLELRIWISYAQDKAKLEDDIMRGIKHKFDTEGVHFPFPQRTISYLADHEAPAETPEFLSQTHQTKGVILVVARDRPAEGTVKRIVDFAERVDGRLVVLHVRPPKRVLHQVTAQSAVNMYLERAHLVGVPVRGQIEVGDTARVAMQVAKEVGAKMAIMGQATRSSFLQWHRSEYQSLRSSLEVPVIAVHSDVDLDDRQVERWRQRLAPPDSDAEESEPEEDEEPES